MTNRENHQRLDAIGMRYLAAVEANDFDTIDATWSEAADDPDLEAMLHALHAELVAEQDAAATPEIDAAIVEAIEKHLPSAEIIRPATGPLTVAEVAEYIRRHPPAGLTAGDLGLNDALLKVTEPLPTDLGVSRVVAWGQRFGSAPEAYWRAFRQAALKLRMRRDSEPDYQLAARSCRPKPPEGKP